MKSWPAEKRVTIHPGEQHVSRDRQFMISTLLGSCVAACLYDPVMRVMGMNHFLLANKRYSKDMPVIASEAGRYGLYAMELLINNMLKAGAQKRNLKAKVFGGGNVLPGISSDSFFAVGEVNSRFVLEFLEAEKIPVLSKGLGGDHGRVIHFVSTDFSVYVKPIARSKTIEVEKKEQQYWKKAINQREQEEQQSEIQFW
ncbi:MAG: chemotaxis protein CheD [Gammaproteobacteria bacterium SHHR-1]|uniref:chemotaxis protein CheD n=1 Tax=Magnetovirga frankeli TaxID=947516 RepID=UPI001292FBEB|nr:chemotaxis protein CheD [gamma proteobacterium SS-5]